MGKTLAVIIGIFVTFYATDRMNTVCNVANDNDSCYVIRKCIVTERYCFSNNKIKVDDGETDNCQVGHDFLLVVFRDIISKLAKTNDKKAFDFRGLDYCTKNTTITTKLLSPIDSTEFIKLYVYSLSINAGNDLLKKSIDELKSKDYITIILTTEAPLLCYLFWEGDSFIIACRDMFMLHKLNNDKIVRLIRESLMNCSLKGIKDNLNNGLRTVKYDSVDTSELMILKLDDAVKLFGKTANGYLGLDVEFILDDALPEFRIELNNIYSKKQRLNKTIKTKEVTWSIDNDKNITVRYEKNGDGYIPKHYMIWKNDAEF
jgi:hypothetical protein